MHSSSSSSLSAGVPLVSHATLLQWVNSIMTNSLQNNANARRQAQMLLFQSSSSTSSQQQQQQQSATTTTVANNASGPLHAITDLSSQDYAQLIVGIKGGMMTTMGAGNGLSSPSSSVASRFTFCPPNNTPKEIHDAHLRNYRQAVTEMRDYLSLADAVGAVEVTQLTNIVAPSVSSLAPLASSLASSASASASASAAVSLSLPQRLCQGDPAAHQALLSAIYSQRRLFPTTMAMAMAGHRGSNNSQQYNNNSSGTRGGGGVSYNNNHSAADYDWTKVRQLLEERELMPDGRPIAWTNNNGGGANNSNNNNSNNSSIQFTETDRATLQLLTDATNHLDQALKLAFSLPIYMIPFDHGGIVASPSSSSPSAAAENKENTAAVKKGIINNIENNLENNKTITNNTSDCASTSLCAAEALRTQEPMLSELFGLMLLAVGETAREEEMLKQ